MSHQTSACHSALPSEALARIERMNAAISAVASAATKYTSGIRIMATSNLINTVLASDSGSDFQNKILRSLRSAYRQSSRYQVAYTDITTQNIAPTITWKAPAASCISAGEVSF